ncbi:MAG: DUF2958 domain-containing protein [Candidatus Cloacimonadota bacterium]|nr:MAG: DUF2958 domain-containing protein [Candidatus Cloacimonadota bacterium]
MKLLTKELREKFPKFRETEEKNPEDIPVIAKFFAPWNSWTWYAIEGEPILDEHRKEIDYHFFGYVRGFANELGYFSLKEMESVKGAFGLGIERDLYFGEEHTLKEVIDTRL